MLGYQKSAVPRTPRLAADRVAFECAWVQLLAWPEGGGALGRFLVPQHEPRRPTALRPRTSRDTPSHFAAASIANLADLG